MISTIDNQVFKSHPIIFNLLKVNNCAGSSSDSQFLTSNFQTVIRFGKQNWCGNWWKFLEFNQKQKEQIELKTSKKTNLSYTTAPLTSRYLYTRIEGLFLFVYLFDSKFYERRNSYLSCHILLRRSWFQTNPWNPTITTTSSVYHSLF